ncbi:6-O-methylguanine DNA methyltransferase [Xylariaceae sp. FL0594]|nr:6-O-methylguanine DNA methyltransferase [Xylariaceae sp. FL0594]
MTAQTKRRRTLKASSSSSSSCISAAIKRHITLPSSPPTALPSSSQLSLIAQSPRGTPFEKRVWALLLQIPRGSVSTYALLAASLRSSPRAVGNALRKNPFAPLVPCHRVVASGGLLGGFKGVGFGENETIAEKRLLLREEGVRFDAKGRVLGTPWGAFNLT